MVFHWCTPFIVLKNAVEIRDVIKSASVGNSGDCLIGLGKSAADKTNSMVVQKIHNQSLRNIFHPNSFLIFLFNVSKYIFQLFAVRKKTYNAKASRYRQAIGSNWSYFALYLIGLAVH